MKRHGYIVIAVVIAIIVVVALRVVINENDKSKTDLSGTTSMEIKELEEKVLGKDWDALDIVDTATRPQEALDLLTELIGNEDPEVREIALNCVAMIQDARVPGMLVGALSDDDDDIRLFALQSLQTAWDESIIDGLISNLRNEDGEIRGGVSLLLGEIGRPEAVEPLEQQLEAEQDENAKRDERLALARLGNAEMKEYFAKQMDVPDSGVRWQGLEDLRYIHDPSLSHRMLPALSDSGQADPVSPPGEPEVTFNRICDKAVNLIAELHGQPFDFETRETKIYSDDELARAKDYLTSLKAE